MAILNDLIVRGSSRLLNKLYCKDIVSDGSLSISGDFSMNGILNIGATTAANAQLKLNNKVALKGYDGWLRINDTSAFASGIYCGSGLLRTDGTFQVGAAGQYLSVTSSRFDVKIPTYMVGNLYMGGTTYYFNTSGIINASTVTTNGANIGTLNCTTKAEFLDVNVKNTLRSVKWDINNVANLGGTFYVAPTLYFSANTSVIVNSISGTSVTLTITDATTISSSTAAGVTWYANSKIKLSGKIGNCVLGTADGTLSATMHSTANTLKCVVNIAEASKLTAGTTYSAANVSNLCVMMYSLYSSVSGTSAARPVGIAMTSYGANKSSAIDIYGGTSDTPNVRIGLLTGISDSTLSPSGWGIYASNGFFKGKIVATSGKIGNFNISTRLYTNNNSLNNTTSDANVYIGDDGISLGKGQFKVTNAGALTAISGSIGGFSITGSYLANGTTTLAGAANSVYLGTGGISCGTAFKVTNTGILTASNLTATGGKIGGWTISGKNLIGDTGAIFKNGVLQSNTFVENTSGVQIDLDTGIIKGSIKASKITAQNSYSIYNGAFENTIIRAFNFGNDKDSCVVLALGISQTIKTKDDIPKDTPQIILMGAASTGEGKSLGINAPDINLNVTNIIRLSGKVAIDKTLGVSGAVTCSSSLSVKTTSSLTGAVTCGASLSVKTTSTLTGAVSAKSTLTVTGVTTINNQLLVRHIEITGEEYAYIDFHHNKSGSDFTSRIITGGAGKLLLGGGGTYGFVIVDSPGGYLRPEVNANFSLGSSGIRFDSCWLKGSVNQGSLAEWKTNITSFTSALSEIDKTDVYNYQLKHTLAKNGTDMIRTGFVIGDGYNLSPYLMNEGKDSIDLYSAIGVTFAGVKELHELVKKQQETILKLNEKLERLEGKAV